MTILRPGSRNAAYLRSVINPYGMKRNVWIMLLVFFACSPDLLVRSDYDKDLSLTQYNTYRWAPVNQAEAANHPLYYNELTDKRIHQAVDREMKKRGYRYADSAQLVIHYHLAVEKGVQLRQDPYGLYGPYWMRPTTVVSYEEGTIIIDVMDARTNSLAWRGWATADIMDASELTGEAFIRKAVSQLFKQYPYAAWVP
jgi:hypothetical protein